MMDFPDSKKFFIVLPIKSILMYVREIHFVLREAFKKKIKSVDFFHTSQTPHPKVWKI